MAKLDLAVCDKAGGLGNGVEGGLAVRVELLAEDGMLGSCASVAGGQGPVPEERVPLSPGPASSRQARAAVIGFLQTSV